MRRGPWTEPQESRASPHLLWVLPARPGDTGDTGRREHGAGAQAGRRHHRPHTSPAHVAELQTAGLSAHCPRSPLTPGFSALRSASTFLGLPFASKVKVRPSGRPMGPFTDISAQLFMPVSPASLAILTLRILPIMVPHTQPFPNSPGKGFSGKHSPRLPGGMNPPFCGCGVFSQLQHQHYGRRTLVSVWLVVHGCLSRWIPSLGRRVHIVSVPSAPAPCAGDPAEHLEFQSRLPGRGQAPQQRFQDRRFPVERTGPLEPCPRGLPTKGGRRTRAGFVRIQAVEGGRWS